MSIVTLALATAALFTGSFEPGFRGWTRKNNADRALLAVKPYKGVEAALVVTHAPTTNAVIGGTAWEVRGERFPVVSGARLNVIARARGTVSMMLFPKGYKGDYMTCLRWYDAKGRVLDGVFAFGLDVAPTEWRTTCVTAVVPSGAVTASLSLGADRPDFTMDDELAVESVRVIDAPDPGVSGSCVSLRDDGGVLVDGKPFFPIGIYGVAANRWTGDSLEHAFRTLKDAGFNTVQTVSASSRSALGAFLALADRLEMKAFVMPAAGYDRDFFSQGHIPEMKRYKSLLAWYVADDTASYVAPGTVAYRSKLCKTLDPARLTLQADLVTMNGINRYEPFVASTDVFLPEIYPCGKKKADGREVAQVVKDMKDVRAAIAAWGNPVKSVWPLIQQFDGWGWERFPTAAELRAMSWASLVHGGRGITWYLYVCNSGRGRGAVQLPGHWRDLVSVVREIAAVQDDLVRRDAPVQPAVEILSGPARDAFGHPSVTALLKSGESPLLVAVNATTNAVTARIAVDGFRRAEALFENRTLPFAQGIADSFAPYGVHVYRLTR